jgi:hypothetical protein
MAALSSGSGAAADARGPLAARACCWSSRQEIGHVRMRIRVPSCGSERRCAPRSTRLRQEVIHRCR